MEEVSTLLLTSPLRIRGSAVSEVEPGWCQTSACPLRISCSLVFPVQMVRVIMTGMNRHGQNALRQPKPSSPLPPCSAQPSPPLPPRLNVTLFSYIMRKMCCCRCCVGMCAGRHIWVVCAGVCVCLETWHDAAAPALVVTHWCEMGRGAAGPALDRFRSV